MTQDEAIETLQGIQKDLAQDPEAAHGRADDVLLDFLRANGHAAVADAWQECHDKVQFWYA